MRTPSGWADRHGMPDWLGGTTATAPGSRGTERPAIIQTADGYLVPRAVRQILYNVSQHATWSSVEVQISLKHSRLSPRSKVDGDDRDPSPAVPHNLARP